MLRAATAASGGTGAPVGDVLLDLALDRAHQRLDLEARRGSRRRAPRRAARRYGSVAVKPWTRRRCWPWTMARTVPSWSWTTWAILASVPTAYSSDGSLMSSCSAWRWVTSAMGPPSATAALSALTLFSRPTWSGHDHLREDDGLAQGDERAARAVRSIEMGCSSTGVDGRFGHQVLLGRCCGRCRGGRSAAASARPSSASIGRPSA